ncbi:MAG: hypothetical protein ACEY3J_00680 [Arsenophonus sp.]
MIDTNGFTECNLVENEQFFSYHELIEIKIANENENYGGKFFDMW